MSTKSLRHDQNERLRAILRELVDGTFGGNASATAKALGISQSLVSEFLAGARGAGPKIINAIADYTGRSVDDLYGRHVVAVHDAGRAYQRLRDHPDWSAQLQVALELPSLASSEAIEATGDVAFSQPPEHITADFIVRMAEAIASATPYRRKNSA